MKNCKLLNFLFFYFIIFIDIIILIEFVLLEELFILFFEFGFFFKFFCKNILIFEFFEVLIKFS